MPLTSPTTLPILPPEARQILLVDDDPDDEALSLRALAQSGIVHTVRVAQDGVEALDQLLGSDEQAFVRPALVLLDLKLQRLDGLTGRLAPHAR